MHDNAPPHKATVRFEELTEGLVFPFLWPAFSPDHNPVESVWNRMKNWIEKHHPDLPNSRQRTPDQLRTIAQAAWDSIETGYLDYLVSTMEERCQAVIYANGGHTK